MSNEKNINFNNEILFSPGLDPNLIGPTLSTVPPFTLPTGPT
ncbi:exosporium leader peptide-containing protein, partial [Xenorhabdus sp. 18]|nr:exosporium leader peptide-containing protein [Xenorhabdus sp. 18]